MKTKLHPIEIERLQQAGLLVRGLGLGAWNRHALRVVLIGERKQAPVTGIALARRRLRRH